MWAMLQFWFFIGTLVFVAWHGNKWFAQKTAAHSDDHEGEKYAYHEERSRYGKLVNLLLSFDVPRERTFRLRRESWFDRLGKGIRLAVEPEAGETVFDKMFFLDSDDETLVTLLMHERKLRSSLIILMGRMTRQHARLISLDAQNGKLTLYMRAFSAVDPVRLREECVAFLRPLLEGIRSLPSTSARTPRNAARALDKMHQVALVMFAIGCGAATWITFMSPDRLTEPWAFIRFSALAGTIAFLALTWASLRHFGRASNRHRALLFWTFFALSGLVCLSFTVLRAVNIHLDFAEHELVAVDKVSLSTYYQRRAGNSYAVHYHLDSSPKYHDEYASISWFEFRRLRDTWAGNDSGPAVVNIHPGLLGFEWKAIDPLPATVAN